MYVSWCAVLYNAAGRLGWWLLADFYFIPLFVFATWLVITTFLHHNESAVPWYSDKEWTFVKGALSSVDRDYSPFNGVVHNIGTHQVRNRCWHACSALFPRVTALLLLLLLQVHHLFPQIPHYHLREATAAFRAKYPELVRVSHESIPAAFARNLKNFLCAKPVPSNVDVFAYE